MALWSVSAAAPPPAPASVFVTSVRFWSLGNTTRVAVELSGEAKYRFETLANPDRLFIDISDARMKMGPKAMHVVKVGDKLIRQVRVAQKEPQVTRVVLDLEGRFEQDISQLSSPNRIMIEVRAPGSKAVETVVTQSRTAVEKIPETPAPAPEPPKAEPVKAEPARPSPVMPPSSSEANNPPTPARPNDSGSRSLIRALGLKLGKVVLDPGHGGNDHGTTGPTGLTEKELVLDITLRLGSLIEQRLGSQVVYTRSTDVFVPLEERSAIANSNHADLFLSIHANASPLRGISGAEVYYLNFTNSKEALETAARENASHGKSIFELRELIQRIALKDRLDESREFAARLQSSLASTWTKMNPTARNRGVKKAPFVVLIGASMPSVLSEVGFISNPRDEAMLKKPEHRQRIAEALFSGIQSYAATLSQVHTAAVPTRD
jgi:N-acetylmuramoyl-L-alanine amidase